MTTDEREAVERLRRVADVLEGDARALLDPADLRTLLRLVEQGASPDGDRAGRERSLASPPIGDHPLREKVADEIAMIQLDPDDPVETVEAWLDPSECAEAADHILAIPEIAEALLLRDTALGRYADALRPASIAEIYGDGLRNASPLAQFIEKDDLPSSAKPPTPR